MHVAGCYELTDKIVIQFEHHNIHMVSWFYKYVKIVSDAD